MISPAVLIAALFTLAPFLTVAFFAREVAGMGEMLPEWAQLMAPAVLCVPYVLVACSAGLFRWGWTALYAVVPIAESMLLWQARRIDPGLRGNWREFLVLAALGWP
jgi:hypothetical protein